MCAFQKNQSWLDTRWSEADLQFWLMGGERPLRLWLFRMEELYIDPGGYDQDIWFCGTCGYKNSIADQTCPECGALKMGRERRAILKLTGRMPHGWMLTNTEIPFDVEVHYCETGNPNSYCQGRRVGRFRACSVISQTTESPASISPEVVYGLCTRYNIRCRVAFISDELLSLEPYRST